ncbi:MAG: ATP-binding protein [Pseudomonadota bacterium]
MKSLSARLLVTVSLLLLVFFGLAIVALESAFRESTMQAIRDRLNVQMLMLIAAADTDEAGRVTLPDQLPEARFMSPGSGLIGQVISESEVLEWRSMSAVGLYLPIEPVSPNEGMRFQRATATDGTEMFSYSLALEWELSTGESLFYTFSVAEGLEPFNAQVGKFRERLMTLFAAVTLLILASQAIVLRWVLRPLRQVAQEVAEIETGDRADLSADYPTELQRLTRNTNRLLDAERKRLARYRNTLGNLAHSLKTPLAIVRNTLERHQIEAGAERSIHEQVDRMSDIVGYQLQRAAASGSTTLGVAQLDVLEVVHAIVDSLKKVYADKPINCVVTAPARVRYRAEKGDLMEVFGNLLDNAFKWCDANVAIDLAIIEGESGRSGIRFEISDDGPGISQEDAQRVLRRGQRADESVAGHGIGLSVVRELVEIMRGSLTLSSERGQGATFIVELPPL